MTQDQNRSIDYAAQAMLLSTVILNHHLINEWEKEQLRHERDKHGLQPYEKDQHLGGFRWL